MKLKLFKADYMGINIHKTDLANFGSSDPPANLQGSDLATRSQINNLLLEPSELLLKM